MKRILFALIIGASVSAQAQGGLIISDSTFTFDPSHDFFTISKIECEPYEHFTEWRGDMFSIGCPHDWVYAEHDDVNESSGILNMVYCPCGCPQTENEARICRHCLREETRVRSWGFHEKTKEDSEYMKLKKKTKE